MRNRQKSVGSPARERARVWSKWFRQMRGDTLRQSAPARQSADASQFRRCWRSPGRHRRRRHRRDADPPRAQGDPVGTGHARRHFPPGVAGYGVIRLESRQPDPRSVMHYNRGTSYQPGPSSTIESRNPASLLGGAPAGPERLGGANSGLGVDDRTVPGLAQTNSPPQVCQWHWDGRAELCGASTAWAATGWSS